MAINKKGILGEKLGMTQVWDENNRVVPVTVVKAGPCVVTQVRTPENDGYSGVQIAFGQIDPRKVTQPMLGHFAKAGVTPRRHLLELRFDDASDYALGQELGADTFEAGSNIDVTGVTKGKGFAGTMKRHGFSWRKRIPRCSQKPPQARFHRSLCNTGSCFQGCSNVRSYGWHHSDNSEPKGSRSRYRKGSDLG
jgi:50S ribosomal protein uL3